MGCNFYYCNPLEGHGLQAVTCQAQYCKNVTTKALQDDDTSRSYSAR